MQRRNNYDYLFRNSDQSCRQQKASENLHKNRNALSKGACQVKFFAAVMNDVAIPEKIVMMGDPMAPVTSKIKRQKCDKISEDARLDVRDGSVANQPTV